MNIKYYFQPIVADAIGCVNKTPDCGCVQTEQPDRDTFDSDVRRKDFSDISKYCRLPKIIKTIEQEEHENESSPDRYRTQFCGIERGK